MDVASEPRHSPLRLFLLRVGGLIVCVVSIAGGQLFLDAVMPTYQRLASLTQPTIIETFSFYMLCLALFFAILIWGMWFLTLGVLIPQGQSLGATDSKTHRPIEHAINAFPVEFIRTPNALPLPISVDSVKIP
jgi:hypothetical protein